MLGAYCGLAYCIGGFTGLGLSFTALSPLVIGGIVGSIVPALLAAWCIEDLLYKFYKKDPIKKDDKSSAILFSIVTPVSAAIGVGLAVAVTAISPGTAPALFIGGVIGVIALSAGLLLGSIVNECIISPIIERFSSEEKECKQV